MAKQAQYIESIEIEALWEGGKHILWKLDPEVNILSGINGVGKSTIINHAVSVLEKMQRGEVQAGTTVQGVTIKLYPSTARTIRLDVVRSFDRPLINGNLLEKLADSRVKTELDWQIYKLQKAYLDYQVTISNRIIEVLTTTTSADEQMKQAALISGPKTKFQNIMDELLSETNKSIDRHSNEIAFVQDGQRLSPYQLSSGEKQILVIMLTALIENGEHYALLMDEPEISLHIEWQKQLIGLIRELNPNAQIILSTHSPAVIMNGWMDRVTEVEDVVYTP